MKNRKIDTNETPRSLASLRAFIKRQFPELNLTRHHDAASYYWFSDDNDLSLDLCMCYTTTISVAHWSHLTYKQWMNEAIDIMTQTINQRAERIKNE